MLSISVRLAPTTRRHDGGTGPAADGKLRRDGEDNEDGGGLNPDGPVVDEVDDRSPPPSSLQLYRSNFNGRKHLLGNALIVARATSDYQDNDDDDDDTKEKT